MDMKKLIQQMTDIESSEKKKLTESAIAECGDPVAPTNPGNPVTMSVTLNASGVDHVSDLIDIMKNAGLEKAGPVAPQMMPMRQDMERLRDIIAGPKDDPDIPGRDDIDGDRDLNQGIVGSALGAIGGSIAGGALGAATGATKALGSAGASLGAKAGGEIAKAAGKGMIGQMAGSAAGSKIGSAVGSSIPSAAGGAIGSKVGDELTDDEELEETMDPKNMMGQIRKLAKGVETSPDEREHRIFAQQIESKLIDLFQYFGQQNDMEKKKIVQQLIVRNKQAQRETDRRNANNMVTVLWDLMNANEAYANEPDEEYQDHNYMTKDLSGGINRQKGAYKAAQPGDNAMAVESPKLPTEGEFYDDEEELTIRWQLEDDEIEVFAFNSNEEEVSLDLDQEQRYIDNIKDELRDQHDDYGDYMMHKAQDDRMESIKEQLYKALTEKRAKPDYLDMDKDGNKTEPMKKAIKDKNLKKKNEVKENTGPRVQQNLLYMDKDALGSGKDRKYFLMDYEMKYGIHYPENFRRQMEEHPIVKRLKDQGYVGPKQLVGWQGDIEKEIEKSEKIAASYKDRKNEFPTQYYGSVKRAEELTKAKQLIDSGKLEEETEVDEKLRLKKGLRRFKKNYRKNKFSFK